MSGATGLAEGLLRGPVYSDVSLAFPLLSRMCDRTGFLRILHRDCFSLLEWGLQEFTLAGR